MAFSFLSVFNRFEGSIAVIDGGAGNDTILCFHRSFPQFKLEARLP